MGIADYFEDWKNDGVEALIVLQDDGYGNWEPSETTGETLRGVKYNRSAAERYFSQTWAADVTDVFVTDNKGSLKLTDKLRIDSVDWSIDSIVDEGSIGEVYTIGIKRTE